MTIDITVPSLGESITEATVARWLKAPGDTVARDEPLVELETDKIAVEVNAEAAGRLADIVAPQGAEVAVGALLGRLEPGAPNDPAPAPALPPLSPSVRRLVEFDLSSFFKRFITKI